MNNINYVGVNIASKIYIFYLRSIPKHPFSIKIKRTISKYLFPRGITVRSPYNKLFRISTFDFIHQEIINNGSYESKSVNLAYRLLSKGGVFIDIGANFGVFTLNVTDEKVKTYAIEPNPVASYQLIENIKLNSDLNINIISTAIGNEIDLLPLVCDSVNNLGNYHLGNKVDNASIGSQLTLVPVIRFSQLVEKLNLTNIDLLKIDVEGFELNILKSINWDTNKYSIKNLIVEFKPNQIANYKEFIEMLKFLSRKGYKINDINGNELIISNLKSFDLIENNIWIKLEE